jgi:hypothetical protein
MVEVGELAGVQGLVEPIMKLESRGGSWAFSDGRMGIGGKKHMVIGKINLLFRV